jgi:hypothetical protein
MRAKVLVLLLWKVLAVSQLAVFQLCFGRIKLFVPEKRQQLVVNFGAPVPHG